jgi:uncharacterized integral membrane protein
MRLVFPVILILLCVVLIGFVITNPSERVTITLGNIQYPDVPLPLVALIALTLGVAFTAAIALVEGATIRLANRRLRREIQRLETENSFLRTQSPEAQTPEPEIYRADPASELPEYLDEEPEVRSASAPVYDPGAIDPATRGD